MTDELEERLRSRYRRLTAAVDPNPRIDVHALLENKVSRRSTRRLPLAPMAAVFVAVMVLAVGGGSLLFGGGMSGSATVSKPPISPIPEPSSDVVASGATAAGTVVSGGVWVRRAGSLAVSTIDGANWAWMSLPADLATAQAPVALTVIDGHTALAAMGSSGALTSQVTRVFMTSDAGATWTSSTLDAPYGMPTFSFVDRGTGYLLVSPSAVFRTQNGGKDWAQMSPCASGTTTVTATSDATVWCGAPPSGDGSPTLSVSRDGGATWNAASLGVGGDQTTHLQIIDAPASVAGGTVIAVGLDNASGISRMAFVRSSDAGSTWVEIQTPQIPAVKEDFAYALDSTHWFVAALRSPQTHLYSTADGGSHWQELPVTGLGNDWYIEWMNFSDPAHGLALVGLGQRHIGQSLLMATSDGGRSWKAVDFGAGAPPYTAPSDKPNP